MHDALKPKARTQRLPLIDAKKRHHPPDDRQEILRDALREAARHLSAERMLIVGENAGCVRPFSRKSLKAFIDNKTKEIDPEHYDTLAAVWLRSAAGRVLRYLDTSDQPQFDKLTNVLASGHHLRPRGATVTGRYFMVHGSYLAEDHYVIRLIEIACLDDNILAVKDTLYDNLNLHRELVAHGVLTFVKEFPQFLFDADENKAGLSLIAGTGTVFNAANELARVTGGFLAVTNQSLVAERSCLLIREAQEAREAMIPQTGIFTRADIAKAHPKHQAAFDALARLPPKRVFPDPMLSYNKGQQGVSPIKSEGGLS